MAAPKKLSAGQIINQLRKAEVGLANGKRVKQVCRELGVSERKACRMLGQARSTQRRIPKRREDEEALRQGVVKVARRFGRYGYRMVTGMLRTQHGPIPQPHRVREVQGPEQHPRLPGGQLRCLAVHHRVLLAPHGGKGVQRHGLARHQGVEEVTQGGQGQIPGGVRSGQLLDKTPGEARRDLAQLDPLLLAPSQKAPHGTRIGAAGVGVGDLGREELVSGEAGILPGPLQEGREGIGQGGGGGVLK